MSEESSTTNETRTCEECSRDYLHEPYFMESIYGEVAEDSRDWNADLYACPTCVPIIEEREKEERQAREEEARRQAREDRAKAAWLENVPPLYRETDIAHADYPKAIHKTAMEWQASRESGEGDTKLFLGLIGPSGRCKTRVVSRVIRRMMWSGQRCRWVNAAEFQRLAQSQFSQDSSGEYDSVLSSSSTVGEQARKRLHSLRTCDVLALDDLGKGRLTDTVASSLYDLIEERTANERVTIWTSNASLDDLLKMLPSDCGGPIVRRLIDFSTIIQL